MTFRFPSRLYAIIGPPDGDATRLPMLAASVLAGGARLIQLRWKGAPSGALLEGAHACAALCRARGAVLIVDDRVDVAIACGADGVHLGQTDLPLDTARRLVPPSFRIGASTHDLEQARRAVAAGADYVAFGPVFATGSKETGYAPRGLDELRRIRAAVDRPLVAIGGIGRETAASVLEAGADAVAMISELVRTANVAGQVRDVLEALDSAPRGDH